MLSSVSRIVAAERSIIHDCRQILNDYLEPNRPSGDAIETISRLLEIIDGPRGVSVPKP